MHATSSTPQVCAAPKSLACSDLPNDIIVRVANRLDKLKDLASMACVCHQFKTATEPVFETLLAIGKVKPQALAQHLGEISIPASQLVAGVLRRLGAKLKESVPKQDLNPAREITDQIANLLLQSPSADSFNWFKQNFSLLRGIKPDQWKDLKQHWGGLDVPCAIQHKTYQLMVVSALAHPDASSIFDGKDSFELWSVLGANNEVLNCVDQYRHEPVFLDGVFNAIALFEGTDSDWFIRFLLKQLPELPAATVTQWLANPNLKAAPAYQLLQRALGTTLPAGSEKQVVKQLLVCLDYLNLAPGLLTLLHASPGNLQTLRRSDAHQLAALISRVEVLAKIGMAVAQRILPDLKSQ